MQRTLSEGPSRESISIADHFSRLPLLIKRQYHKDQFIFLEGEPGDSCFFILSGRVKVVHQSFDGKEVTLAILGKNELFGEMALLDGKARCASVVALTPIEAMALSDFHLRWLIEKEPSFSQLILAMSLERLRSTNTACEHLALSTVKERLGHMLLSWHSREAGHGIKTLSFRLPLTHQEIASVMGTSRETVTRTLKDLQDEGLLSIEKGLVTIRDMAGLARLAGMPQAAGEHVRGN
ncbi:MAG: Crp/Fnr family transcriptional regulator [Candidatus Eremiobacteraeota bacterium]|nr:Crp/Fnr family transcriptional regulator [Candidatus Eremiobacteraeota bacterium]